MRNAMYCYLIFAFLLSLIQGDHGIYTRIYSKPTGIIFKYSEGILGETGLHECQRNEACNALHNRFWMPVLSERLCRCPNGRECPWQWSKTTDKHSMFLNNRSIMKFCDPLEKDVCTRKDSAVVVYGNGTLDNTFMIPYNISANCNCPQGHYWKLKKFRVIDDGLMQVFKCAKQRTCESLDFCGHVRADLYSVYYRCSCPEGHLCLYKNKTLENVQELLYSGPAYKAYCYPF